MLLATLFFAIPPFLYLLVTDASQLLVLRFVHGFATAVFSPVAAATVADLYRKERGERLGWFQTVYDVGAAVGPLVGGFVLYSLGTFSATYLLVGLIGFLPILVVFRVPDKAPTAPKPGEPSRARKFFSGMGQVLSHGSLLATSTTESAVYFGFGILAGFLPLYLLDLGYNDAQIGFVLGVQLVTTLVAKPFAGRVSDRVGRKPTILFGVLLCAAVLPLIVQVNAFILLCVLSGLYGFGMAVVTPSTAALAADMAKAGSMGAALGVLGTIRDIGEAGGPIIAGFIIARASYGASFNTAAAVLVVVAVLFAVAARLPQPAAQPAPQPA
jgi:MFS family permease